MPAWLMLVCAVAAVFAAIYLLYAIVYPERF